MKLLQLINARTLVVLFLTTASISGYKAGELWSAMKDVERAADKAHAGAERARLQLTKLRALMGDAREEPAPALLPALAQISIQARQSALSHGLALAAVSGGQDVLSAADRLPGTALRSVRVSYRGVYSSYQGLQAWVAGLHRSGAAIVHMQVTGKEFDVGVRIYGKDESNG
jgi:hypothetical protein